MTDTTQMLDNIWTLALILFMVKLLPDCYMSYFKWVQALAAKKATSMPHQIEQKIVNYCEANVLWIAVFLLMIFALAPFLNKDFRFPCLTLINFFVATLISIFGSLGDYNRKSTVL